MQIQNTFFNPKILSDMKWKRVVREENFVLVVLDKYLDIVLNQFSQQGHQV